MKTAIIFHGGESWNDGEEYIKFLSTSYNLGLCEKSQENIPGWKERLKNTLIQNDWKVYAPQLPKKHAAIAEEWKIIARRIFEELNEDDEISIVGHSLGGIFSWKILNELFSKKEDGSFWMGQKRYNFHQIHLVAAPLNCGDFRQPQENEMSQGLGKKLHIWHSRDDMVVPFADGEKIAQYHPNAQFHAFEMLGHCNGSYFPELEATLLTQ